MLDGREIGTNSNLGFHRNKRLFMDLQEKVIEKVQDIVQKEATDLAPEKDSSYIGTFLDKVISRKLLVWIVATGFLYFGKISGDEWCGLSLAYIGAQACVDAAAKWKNAGK